MITFSNQLLKAGIHFQGPVIDKPRLIHFVPSHHSQVVHHIAATDDQHAFPSELVQFPCQLVMVWRILGIVNTHLQYSKIGFGIHMPDDCPAAMLQYSVMVALHCCSLYESFDMISQLRLTGSRILRIKHGLRNHSVVMDSFRKVNSVLLRALT